MEFEKYYVVANTREQFLNEVLSSRVYNDHPSKNSIDQIVSSLKSEGYNADYFGGVEKLMDAYSKKITFPKTLFLNLSDGLTQQSRKAQSAVLLEMLNAKYAGSDPMALLMANNKYYAKKVVSKKIRIANDVLLYNPDTIPSDVIYPVVIKPNGEGSSLGITQDSICNNEAELKSRLPLVINKYKSALVEQYIPGYEVTCFLIGNKGNYLMSEVIVSEYNGITYFDHFVFGIKEKSEHTRKEHLAYDFLTQKQIKDVCLTAQLAFELLDMHDFARVDFRLSKNGQLTFIEINGNPVISQTSEIGLICNERKISFGSVISKIIDTAEKRLFSHD